MPTTNIDMTLPNESEKDEEEIKQQGKIFIQETLNKIEKECESLLDELIEEEILENKLEELNGKVSSIGKVFNTCLNDMLSLDLNDQEIFFQSMKVQGFISRLAHKIQKRRYVNNEKKFMNEIEEEKKNLQSINEKIVDETSKLKESALTITSLVFMAFTFIQLNFVAFQGSKDYLVFDRLILFSGINIFLILGIYTVFSMIKSIIDKNDPKISGVLKGRIGIPIGLLVGVFILALNHKSSLENKPKYSEEENYVEYLLTVKNKSLKEIEKNMTILKEDSILLGKEIEEKKIEVKDLELIAKKIIDTKITEYENRVAKLEEKIVMLETENNSLKSIKLVKKEENEKILIE